MKIVNCAEMADIDCKSIEEYQYPAILLMENAAFQMKELLQKNYNPLPGPICVIAGKGNNGGDAIALARQLFNQGTKEITIALLNEKKGSLQEAQAVLAQKLGINIIRKKEEIIKEIAGAKLIIDGIAGTGIKGSLKSPLSDYIKLINESKATIVSLDLPSGLSDSFEAGFPAVKAKLTLTVGLPKSCLYSSAARPFCGKIKVLSIGFPEKLLQSSSIKGTLLSKQAEKTKKLVSKSLHKKQRGHLFVFAGNRGTSGAAYLAAQAAARSLCGMVSLYLNDEIYASQSCQYHSVMVHPLSSFRENDLEKADTLLIGPGWGKNEDRLKLIEMLIKSGKKCLIDADGISLLAALIEKQANLDLSACLLTPHPGEMQRLLFLKDPSEKQQLLNGPLPFLRRFSQKHQCFIHYKSAASWICSPTGQFWIYDGMNPAMATAGSGDILAGISAGLLCYTQDRQKAAISALQIHQESGRICYQKKGWFAAEELLSVSGKVVKEFYSFDLS